MTLHKHWTTPVQSPPLPPVESPGTDAHARELAELRKFIEALKRRNAQTQAENTALRAQLGALVQSNKPADRRARFF